MLYERVMAGRKSGKEIAIVAAGRKLVRIMRAMPADSPAERRIAIREIKIVEIVERFEYNHGRQDQQWGVVTFDKVDVGRKGYSTREKEVNALWTETKALP